MRGKLSSVRTFPPGRRLQGTIAIIGGGIGGLTTAIALQQRGLEATVYESAPELKPLGAGIVLSPNAMQVMARLGLSDAVCQRGRALERGEVRDIGGQLLTVLDARDAERRYGAPTIALHRAALGALLAERVPGDRLRLGARFLFVKGASLDAPHELHFVEGPSAVADLVIGADGAGSSLRQFVEPLAKLGYSGQTSYRGVAPIAKRIALPPVSREIWAPGQRFGFVRISEDDIYWFCTLDEPYPAPEPPGEDRHARIARLFAHFPAPVPSILAESDPASVLRLPMLDLEPPRYWHRLGMVLVGDAAHATTPNLGQGGAQAIEDAWVLADSIANAIESAPRSSMRALAAGAFARYERLRAPKARMVVRTSRRIGEMAHWRNPVARALRNVLLAHTPKQVMMKQLDALFRLAY